MNNHIINHIEKYRIGVATARAKPYYKFTQWLSHMGIKYDVLVPLQMHDYSGHIVLTTPQEVIPVPPTVRVMYDYELAMGYGIALATLLSRCGADAFDDHLVIGIDPGKLLGVAVFYAGQEVEQVLFFSDTHLVSYISVMLRWSGSSYRTVRVGNGDMHTARRLAALLSLEDLPPYNLEFVNEANTSSRSRNCNQRGKRDMLAARTIAQIHPLDTMVA